MDKRTERSSGDAAPLECRGRFVHGLPGRSRIRIALLGLGRMGRLVERLAPGHQAVVVLRLDGSANADGTGLSREALGTTDVAIDFSTAEAVPGNLARLCEYRVDTVLGTTGWHDGSEELLDLARRSGIGLVHGANFAFGVNALYGIARDAARAMAGVGRRDLAIFESHHRGKRDAPSGTALRLRHEVRGVGWEGRIDVTSQRTGYLPGTHELRFDSEGDTLAIRHTVRSRTVFAEGALAAAHWIHGRPGVYDFGECWEEVAAVETRGVTR